MGVLSHSRGHAIYFDGSDWRYADNGNLAKDEERERVCVAENILHQKVMMLVSGMLRMPLLSVVGME